MRSTEDLIKELNEEALKFNVVCLVVTFENDSIMVFSTDEQPLKKLNDAVEAGGKPVGMIGAKRSEDSHFVDFYPRPLTEYVNDGHVRNFLTRLIDKIKGRATEQLGGKAHRTRSDWIN